MKLAVVGKTYRSLRIEHKGNTIVKKLEDYTSSAAKAIASKRSGLDVEIYTNIDDGLRVLFEREKIQSHAMDSFMPMELVFDNNPYREEYSLPSICNSDSDIFITDGIALGKVSFLDYTDIFPEEIDIRESDYAFLSLENAKKLAGVETEANNEDEILSLLSKLTERLWGKRIILTLDSGAYYQHKMELFYAPRFKTFEVDGRAKKDAFISYFASSLIHGLDEENALFIAEKAEGLSSSRFNASLSMPYENDIFPSIK